MAIKDEMEKRMLIYDKTAKEYQEAKLYVEHTEWCENKIKEVMKTLIGILREHPEARNMEDEPIRLEADVQGRFSFLWGEVMDYSTPINVGGIK